MTKEELINAGVKDAPLLPRGDLQGWIEAECLVNPELDADEILAEIDRRTING